MTHTPQPEQEKNRTTKTKEQLRKETVQPTTISTGQKSKTTVLVAVLAAVLLTGVVLAPLVLSGTHIITWSHDGLGLYGTPVLIVIYALDGTAGLCVILAFWRAWTGRSTGIWGLLVWVLAGLSAFAQYRQGLRDLDTTPDAWWFFPAMALSAPFMLELVLRDLRKWKDHQSGRIGKQHAKFAFTEWVPLIGSFKDTYGAWRTARLLGIETHDGAVQQYRQLCPEGSIRVLKAIRELYKNKPSTTPEPVLVQVEEQHSQKVQAENSTSTTPVLNNPVQVQPAVQKKVQQPVLVQAKNSTALDLYNSPIQETPVQNSSPSEQDRRKKDNDLYLGIIRETWPDEIPSGNKVRTALGVNYAKAQQLLETIKTERGTE